MSGLEFHKSAKCPVWRGHTRKQSSLPGQGSQASLCLSRKTVVLHPGHLPLCSRPPAVCVLIPYPSPSLPPYSLCPSSTMSGPCRGQQGDKIDGDAGWCLVSHGSKTGHSSSPLQGFGSLPWAVLLLLLLPVFLPSEDCFSPWRGSQAAAWSDCPEPPLPASEDSNTPLQCPSGCTSGAGRVTSCGAHHMHFTVPTPFVPSEKEVDSPSLSDRKAPGCFQ